MITKRQRETLDKLRELVGEYQPYIPYIDNKELREVFNCIGKTLYGVLVDNPNNEFIDEDMENTSEALEKFEELLKIQKSIQ